MSKAPLFTRGTNRLREMIEVRLDRAFAFSHPTGWAAKAIDVLAPFLARLTPNDKWSLPAHLPLWVEALKVPPLPCRVPPKRIFIISLYRGQFTLDLVLAILLAWRGHHITFGYLPRLQSPIKPPLRDHPSSKFYLARTLMRMEGLSCGRIRCVDLSEEALTTPDVDGIGIDDNVKSDVVMFSRRETIDMADTETREAWNYYKAQALSARQLARSFFIKNKQSFDLCLVANGTTFEPAQFCHVAKEVGLPVNTFEKFAFRSVRILTHGDDIQSFKDLAKAWDRRFDLGYLEEGFLQFATGRAYGLLQERRNASKATWAWTLQNSPQQSTDESLIAAGIGPEAPFVLVCPNVPYDAGYSGLLGIFPSMRDWLRRTVTTLLERTNLQVVVRAHPAEGAHWGGKESSAETLSHLLNHPRLIFIADNQKVNTYGLMERCKFGAVFSSTTGLEMAMMGKRVVVGASVYYAKRGFTTEADSLPAYDEMLIQLASEERLESLSNEQRDGARLFHFLLHFIIQWPYPYDKPSDIRRLPPANLLKGDVAKYLPFLDALTLTAEEWETQMVDYLRPGVAHVPVNVQASGR
ncbi:capsule polysaccharide biosynthesis family protein [Rhodoplanes sp. Z2-YC6860]|nr:capsule polysaccharide biosynthesis family protein [Rhodoplanes sp. Z2-YC6860]